MNWLTAFEMRTWGSIHKDPQAQHNHFPMGILLKVSEAASLHRCKWKIGGMACPAQLSDTPNEGVKDTRLTAQLAKLHRPASNLVQVYLHAGCLITYIL